MLEAEFRRFIYACTTMSDSWRALAQERTPTYALSVSISENPLETAKCGYVVYAMDKVDMYAQMEDKARQLFMKAGGGFPGEGEALWDFMDKRRPIINFNWENVGSTQENRAELDKERQDILRRFHAPVENLDGEGHIDDGDVDEEDVVVGSSV